MKDKRIGNDLAIVWSLRQDGKAFNIEGKPVNLYLKTLRGIQKVDNYVIEENKVRWTFFGKDQQYTGRYSLVLIINEGVEGMITIDACDFVRLVSCSCKVSDGADEYGVEIETIEIESTLEYVSGGQVEVDTDFDTNSMNPIANGSVTRRFINVESKLKGITPMLTIAPLSGSGVIAKAFEELDLANRVGEAIPCLIKKDNFEKYYTQAVLTVESFGTEGYRLNFVIMNADSGATYSEEDGSWVEVFYKPDCVFGKGRTIVYSYNPQTGYVIPLGEGQVSVVMPPDLSVMKVTYEELVSLRNNGLLVPGKKYRIIDYVTSTAAVGSMSARHPFDIVVTALDERTLSEEASVLPREGDTYFDEQDLSAWKVWYCIDNDRSRFNWAGEHYEYIDIEGISPYGHECQARCYYVGHAIGQHGVGAIYATTRKDGNIAVADDVRFLSMPYDGIENPNIFGELEEGMEVFESWLNGQPEMDMAGFATFGPKLSKGIIYRMVDERNNDIAYDFKNICYLTNGSEKFLKQVYISDLFWLMRRTYALVLDEIGAAAIYEKVLETGNVYYTFMSTVDGKMADDSLLSKVSNCLIRPAISSGMASLNSIMLYGLGMIESLTFDSDCRNIYLEGPSGIESCTFGKRVHDVNIRNYTTQWIHFVVTSGFTGTIQEDALPSGDFELKISKKRSGAVVYYCEADLIN